MTDLMKFQDLYASFGIYPEREDRAEEIWLFLEEGTHPMLKGYAGFHTAIVFNYEGKFLYQGFWE